MVLAVFSLRPVCDFRRDVPPLQRHGVRAERVPGTTVPDAQPGGALLRGLSQRVPAVRVGALGPLRAGLRGQALPLEEAVGCVLYSVVCGSCWRIYIIFIV